MTDRQDRPDRLQYAKQPVAGEGQAVTDATDQQQVKRAGDRAKADRRRELEDLRAVIDTEAGRRLIARLFDVAGVHRSTFHSHGSIASFNEGARNTGLVFLKDITEHFPDQYLVMLQEMQRRQQERPT